MKRLLYSLLFITSFLFGECTPPDGQGWVFAYKNPPVNVYTLPAGTDRSCSGPGMIQVDDVECTVLGDNNTYCHQQVSYFSVTSDGCPSGNTVDPVTGICIPKTCEQLEQEIKIPDSQSCYASDTQDLKHYYYWDCNENPLNFQGSCNELDPENPPTCPDGEVFDILNGGCYPDSDGDGVSDKEERREGSDPNDASSTPENLEGNDPLCGNLNPFGSTHLLGWTDNGIGSSTSCTAPVQNSYDHEGDTFYYSQCDPNSCLPVCTCYSTQCSQGKVYMGVFRTCVTPPSNTNCSPDYLNADIINDSGVCYEVVPCVEDSSKEYERNNVDCPDSDGDGEPDLNLTKQSDKEEFFKALQDYGASTKAEQERILNELESIKDFTQKESDLLKANNNKLDEVNLNLFDLKNKSATVDTSNLESLLSTTNSNTALTNSNLSGISSQISDIDLGLDGIADDLRAVKDELTGDFEVSDKDDLQEMTGEDTFDDIETELESSFAGFDYGDIFGLNSSIGSIPTYTVSLAGSTFTLMEPSMFNGVNFDMIRALMLMIAALSGFMTVLRTV